MAPTRKTWAEIADKYNQIGGSSDHELFWWKYSKECGEALNRMAEIERVQDGKQEG